MTSYRLVYYLGLDYPNVHGFLKINFMWLEIGALEASPCNVAAVHLHAAFVCSSHAVMGPK